MTRNNQPYLTLSLSNFFLGLERIENNLPSNLQVEIWLKPEEEQISQEEMSHSQAEKKIKFELVVYSYGLHAVIFFLTFVSLYIIGR